MTIIDALKKRRAVNHFDSTREIPEIMLKTIIDEANLCPTSYNTQPQRLVIVETKEAKEELFEKACPQEKVKEASAVLIFYGHKEGFKNSLVWADLIEKKMMTPTQIDQMVADTEDMIYQDDEKKRKFIVRNCALFAMSIMLVAQEHGLETHPMIGFNPQGIKDLYRLPSDSEIPLVMCIGYHNKDKAVHPRGMRLKYEDIVTRKY